MENRILVVDDEIAILVPFKKMLSRPSVIVDTAQTMEEAESLLKLRPYQVVIADLRLTGVLGEEGLEIIRYVRDHGLDTRIILITGYGSPEIKAKALAMGADYYYEKPVQPRILKETLQALGVGL